MLKFAIIVIGNPKKNENYNVHFHKAFRNSIDIGSYAGKTRDVELVQNKLNLSNEHLSV